MALLAVGRTKLKTFDTYQSARCAERQPVSEPPVRVITVLTVLLPTGEKPVAKLVSPLRPIKRLPKLRQTLRQATRMRARRGGFRGN